jgi:cell division protease FtsH
VLSPKELSLTNGANGSTAAIANVTESVPAKEAAPEERPES